MQVGRSRACYLKVKVTDRRKLIGKMKGLVEGVQKIDGRCSRGGWKIVARGKNIKTTIKQKYACAYTRIGADNVKQKRTRMKKIHSED